MRPTRRSASSHLRFAAWFGLAVTTGTAPAGEIYKSIDANGNVVYSDRADPSRPQSTVVLLDEPGYPPHELHVCGTQNCFTLTLAEGRYERVDGVDDTWTIERFTPASVILRRHGTTTGGQEVTYSGTVANDRLVNVSVNGVPTGGLDASWGAALNTLPGSNAERDAGTAGNAGISSVSAATPPPALPDEDQTDIPEPGYLWTPGYWYWRDRGFFWVPGAWVRPPQPGYLWTPAFWVLAGTVYIFHPGHWGTTVGFYGGINYGHGYFGTGYSGGRWVNGSFAYNRSVNRLSPAVKNTYAQPAPAGVRGVNSFAAVPGGVATAAATARSPANAAPTASASANTSASVRQARAATSEPAVVPTQAAARPTPAAKPARVRPIKPAAPRS